MNFDYKNNHIQLTGKNIPLNDRMMQQVSDLQRLTLPCSDGENQPVHFIPVYIPDGFAGYKYWGAFTPFTNGNSSVENPEIVASNDGITWVVPEGLTNPIDGPPVDGFYPDVWLGHDGTNLILYYLHLGTDPNKAYRRTSADGVTWSEATEVDLTTVTSGGLARLSATEWVCFPLTTSARGSFQGERYTSADGITWARDRHVAHNLPGPFGHSTVYVDGSGYHFLTCAYGAEPDDLNEGIKLYYGFSEDGYRVMYDTTPLLMPDTNKGPSAAVYTSAMIPGPDNTFYVYVSGRNLGGTWGVWLMQARLNVSSRHLVRPLRKSHTRKLFNALEIRDIVIKWHNGNEPLVEFNEYTNKVLHVLSNLDQAVTLKIYSMSSANGKTALYKADGNVESVEVAANSGNKPIFIDKNTITALGIKHAGKIYIGLSCAVAPTLGSVTVDIAAWD